MREHTLAERARMLTGPRQYHAKLRVRNTMGTWLDLSAYMKSFSITGNTDDQMDRGTFVCHKTMNLGSIVPLMVSSPMNTDGGNFAPAVNSGNRIEFSIAVTAPLATPLLIDWHVMFTGRIDRPDWPNRSELTMACRDLGAYLADNKIIETQHYEEALLDERIQQVINANEGNATLVVPNPPDWVVRAGDLEGGDVPLLGKLRDYAAQIAWDVRYEFTTGDNFELVLYEVDRAKTVPDMTFGPGTYTNIPVMGFDDEGVRNWVSIDFRDRVSGKRSRPSYKSPTSIDIFGRKPIQIRFTDTDDIDTFIEADRMGLGILNDLSIPPFDHAVECKLFWPVQRGDLLEFEANNNHYDEPQKFGVYAYEHSGGIKDKVFTCDSVITVRGGPTGGYRRWLEKEGPRGTDEDDPPAPIFGAQLLTEGDALGGVANDGRIWWEVEWDKNTYFIKVWAEEGEDENVATPDVGSQIEEAITMYRPEGTEGQVERFRTWIPIAIRPGKWARVCGAGFDRNNRIGAIASPPAAQAVDTLPGVVRGSLSAMTVTPTPLSNGFLVANTIAATDPTTPSFLFIERDNTVIFQQELPLGASGVDVNFLDEGLWPGTKHTYTSYVWTHGHSGQPYGWLTGVPPVPGDPTPKFFGQIREIVLPDGTKRVRIDWSVDDPTVNRITLYGSSNGRDWNFLQFNGVVGNPDTGTFYDTNLASKYYMLMSGLDGSIVHTSAAYRYTAPPPLPGGPSTAAPILTSTIINRGGVPVELVSWTCENGDADELIMEWSAVGAGTWAELMRTSSIASGTYERLAFDNIDIRMRAVRLSDSATLSTSNTV